MSLLDKLPRKPSPDFKRLRKALTRDGEPDRVPFYELFVDLEVREACLGRKTESLQDVIEFYWRAGYDYVPASPNMAKANFYVQGFVTEDTAKLSREGGRSWWNEQRGPIGTWEELEALPWPEITDETFAPIEQMSKLLPEGMKLVAQWGGIFEAASFLMGLTNLSFCLVDQPDLVAALFERLGNLFVALYTGFCQFDSVSAATISDDLGFRSATLISPDHLRQYVLPWHKKLAKIVHDSGRPVILHCCGNVAAVMDDLIDDVGIDAKHSYEDAIQPVIEAKKQYGDRIGILGGVDMDKLCRLEEPELRRYIESILENCAPGGGYAFGSGNSIANYIPLENYLLMLKMGMEY